MNNFNILGFTEKSNLYVEGEGGHGKPIYSGDCLKRGLEQFKEALGEKEGDGNFEGVMIPQCTLWLSS